MDNRLNKIKKIANKLSDYNYVIEIVNNPGNKQKIGENELPLYDEVTLSHGIPAICMLFAELSYIFPEEEWDIKAHSFLERLQDKIQKGAIYDLSMFSGYAGIGLTVECLSREGIRYKKFSNHINNYIKNTFPLFLEKLYNSKYCFMRDYDVISGVSGILAYTITQKDMTDISKDIGNYLVCRCKEIKYENVAIPGFYIPQENQFLEQDRIKFQKGNFNLGLSHGIPGILLALCMLIEKEIEVKGAYEAALVCSKFLYDYVNEEKERWGAYLSFEDYYRHKAGKLETRDAWCYGSPGVCYALYISGMILGKEEYERLSVRVMENVMQDLQGIYSPTFCHGFSGVGYIYWRFYELTGIKEFKEFSFLLADKVWDFYDIKYPFGFKDIEYGNDTDQVGLLSGVPGILLTLLAISGKKKTKWDYGFMLGNFINQ